MSDTFSGGNVPYGYRRNGNGLEVDHAEAETVRIIFALAERGESRSGIARLLSARGLDRMNGKPWTQRQVVAILHREGIYRSGIVRYGESRGRNENLVIVR